MERSINRLPEDNFFMVLKSAMNFPGVKINRKDFLEKELSRYFPASIVNEAVKNNPAKAGISVEQLEHIANACIKFETNKVTAISAAAGVPGGFAMLGTVPVDIAQYFAHIVRVLQKLLYLYGWEELYNSDGEFDDETVNQLTLFIGVMFGVQAANKIINKLAIQAAVKLEKSLAKKALAKGVIYPIVKKVASILGVKMTKQIFARGVAKTVPILGAAFSGGLTYATFKPESMNLKKHLKGLPIADIGFYNSDTINDIEVDFYDAELIEIE